MTIEPMLFAGIIVAAVLVSCLVTFFVTRTVLNRGKTESSEEVIRDLVTTNEELAPAEKRMINEVIDLGDMTAQEVMKPRVDMMMVASTETVRQAVDRMRGTGYSRLPVYNEDVDDVIGIAYFKNLVQPLIEGEADEPVANFVAEAKFVPQTKDLLPLLSEMQAEHCPMAIVVDEYGGTGGLVTIEDIVEEVVGEICDETDRERGMVEALSENQWRVNGSLPVDDARELGFPVEESDDYETIAGWLLDQVDEVPQVGDEYDVDGFSFKIEGMRRHRIQRLRVMRQDA